MVDAANGEYRSAKTYQNIRDVVGLFGDSNVGLQTYWHAVDLRATNEQWLTDADKKTMPVYCGPGIWYDKQTGHIHARLAHTHLPTPGIAFLTRSLNTSAPPPGRQATPASFIRCNLWAWVCFSLRAKKSISTAV